MRPGLLRGGLGQMALAAFFFSVMSLLVRVAGTRLPSAQIVLARAAVSLVISFWMLRAAGVSPWGKNRRTLALRGLFGFGGLNCFYWALVHLPLAEATVLQYTNPVFTALLAVPVLGERLRRRHLASVALSLAGVVLVARPATLFGGAGAALPALPVAVALLGAALSAAAYVTVRKAGGSEHPLVVVFWFPLVATPLALPAALGAWVQPAGVEWLVLLGVGVSTQIAQVFMTRGLLLETAARATAASYLQVVFAAGWGALLLAEAPDLATGLGSALIGCGLLLLAADKGDER
jgi:drug/metabolite transporter (DMT)-like permease